jgi:hypothetical protein
MKIAFSESWLYATEELVILESKFYGCQIETIIIQVGGVPCQEADYRQKVVASLNLKESDEWTK